MELSTLLTEMVAQNASDLHLVVGLPPIFRIQGDLVPRTSPDKRPALLGVGAVDSLLSPYLSDGQRVQSAERDLTMTLRQDDAVFHCQVFRERGRLAAAIRVVPLRIWSLSELGLPPILETLTQRRRGLILVTGPTGSGKSTTAAAMVEHINKTRAERIVTIEDRIEYEFRSKLSLITQRQVGEDVENYEQGILSAMNSDLDVALIGELRSMEAVRAALVLAETGHLVFSTLSVETASEAVQRLIEVFPEPRAAIRRLLARTLQAVIAQKLLPVTESYRAKTGKGRTVANEILVMTQRVRQMILEGQTDLTLVMEAGHTHGMQTMDEAILKEYRAGRVSYEVAELHMEDHHRLGPP